MINLIGSNSLGSKKQFLGFFCNVKEAKAHAQNAVNTICPDVGVLDWEEVDEGPFRELFTTIGTLVPVSVLRAYYNEACLVILDYGF